MSKNRKAAGPEMPIKKIRMNLPYQQSTINMTSGCVATEREVLQCQQKRPNKEKTLPIWKSYNNLICSQQKKS